MGRHKLITVIGPIGSGKTTASQILSQKLQIPLLDADLFEENPFLPSYIEDNTRWSFATELFFTLGRIKKLSQLNTLLKKSSVVVDSGLIMSYEVYTKNHLVHGTMTAAEWDFFTRIVQDYQKSLPNPDIIVHLLASPETQLKRIKDRGRSFESGYTLDYLQSITNRLSEYATSLNNSPTVYVPFETNSFDKPNEKYKNDLLQKVLPYFEK